MSRKYLSFDIETAKITPDGVRYGFTEQGEPAAQMSKEDCVELVHILLDNVHEGYTLLTHNGVGFDLDILAEESGLLAECCDLAVNSVDTCLHIHCLKGFPVGLDAIAKGMGLQGKTKGMNGLIARQMWAV